MTNKVDNKLRYSAIIDNRSVVAAICINELEFLIIQTDFVQDRQMLQSMICGCAEIICKVCEQKNLEERLIDVVCQSKF